MVNNHQKNNQNTQKHTIKNNQTRKNNHLSNAQSQLRMYDCMSPQVVSKLLYEFQNGSQSRFVDRIQEKREQDNTLDKTLQISARIPSNSLHVYLNYKKDNTRVMHFSLHMCPENVSTNVGPSHAKQNGSEGRLGVSIHVYRDPNNPSKIRVELGSEFGKQPMNTMYRKEAELVAESLDDFFNEATQNISQSPLHTNAQRVHQNIQTTLISHNKIQRRKSRKASARRRI